MINPPTLPPNKLHIRWASRGERSEAPRWQNMLVAKNELGQRWLDAAVIAYNSHMCQKRPLSPQTDALNCTHRLGDEQIAARGAVGGGDLRSNTADSCAHDGTAPFISPEPTPP